jgi:hypothetical protein
MMRNQTDAVKRTTRVDSLAHPWHAIDVQAALDFAQTSTGHVSDA